MTTLQTPTPLRSGQMGVIREDAATLDGIKGMLDEARAWGMLGFDLEWMVPDGRITWIGIGTAKRAISLWRPALSDAAMDLLRVALADPALPKLCHNVQADIETWQREEGPVAGVFEDTMLQHHAAYPGIAHDLQAVTSQFLVVPPWKTWHKEAQKQAEEGAKAEKAAAKETAKEQAKAEKVAVVAKNKIAKAIEKGAKQVGIFEKTYGATEAVTAAHAALCAADGLVAVEFALDKLTNIVIPAERDRCKTERSAKKQAAHEARNTAVSDAAAKRKAERRAALEQLAAGHAPRVANANPAPSSIRPQPHREADK